MRGNSQLFGGIVFSITARAQVQATRVGRVCRSVCIKRTQCVAHSTDPRITYSNSMQHSLLTFTTSLRLQWRLIEADMVLELSSASEADATRIADIHMAAFGSNKMLRAQFPTPSIRKELEACIAEKALADIRDPMVAVLVARNNEDTVISFAKWALPVPHMETYAETPWHWPEGTNLTVLNRWITLVEDAQKRILAEQPCYRKSWQRTRHYFI